MHESDVPPSSGTNRQLDLILALGRITADARDLRVLVAQALEVWLDALEADVGIVHELRGDRLVLLGLASPSAPLSAGLRAFLESMPIALDTLASLAVRTRRVHRVSAAEWPVGCRALAEELVVSFGAVAPLHAGDRLVGTIVILRRQPRSLRSSEIRLLESSAAQLGAAIEHARLLGEERQRAEQLAAVNEIGRLITEPIELENVLSVGVRHLAKVAGGVNVFVMLVEGDDLVSSATSLDAPEALGLRLPLASTSVATTSLRERRTIVVDDVETDARVMRGVAQKFGHRAVIATPLFARGAAVGSVVLGLTRAGDAFSEHDVEYTVALTNQLAIAVANARLVDDLKRSYTQLERAQGALVERERLAALGELSAVVAHEVRNPLAIIWNSLGSLRHKVPAEGDVATLLGIVEEESSRLNRMVGDLLDYARPNQLELRREDLGAVLHDAVEAARAGQGADGAMVSLRVEREVPPVLADARLLRQALVNLVSNALQAVSPGGRIEVGVARDGDRGRARIDVVDDGDGLSSEAQHRLFEPFFTTKATGTGLGLALVKRIVEGHGGTVTVAPAPSQGTVFSVFLPFAGPPSVPPTC
ncbi:MAG: GAF domain-containing protein [Deltaproteobacteria bacterium]|nr:GAF domain-containing protein [Deltaproteobacteria bacterium]